MRMKRVFVYEYLSAADAEDAALDRHLLAQGVAMRDALTADLAALPGIAVTCAGSPQAPAHGTSAAPDPGESAPAFVHRQAASHDLVWIVAPESGGVLEQLHAAVQSIEPAPLWIGCDAPAIRIASSKRATLDRVAGHGVCTPLAFIEEPSTPVPPRWVVKPDDGAGAVDTRVHSNREAALADWASRRPAGTATIEPWVDGEALSLSLLAAGGACSLVSVNRQQISINDDGSVEFDGVQIAALALDKDSRVPALRKLATQVAKAIPGLRGFVGIDLVWHATHGPVLIEVNPRLTSAYVGLSRALKRNLALDILALHGAAGIEPPDA